MLDYGVRSRCCHAPIRLGTKTLKKTKTRVKIWICCACGARDVSIVPRDQPVSQEIKSDQYRYFTDPEEKAVDNEE